MKRVTASEARKQWFRLLDEVAAGEVVVLERNGHRLVLHREEERAGRAERQLPHYKKLLRAPNDVQADEWGWEWRGPEGDVVPVRCETQ